MLVIALCAAVVLAGVAGVVRWGDGPPTAPPAPVAGVVRTGLVIGGAGVLAGFVAGGAGGRLVMRVLALTTPDAHGSFTEGGALVGEITAGGTLGLIIFAGGFGGLISAVFYAVLHPLLPRGRTGGVVLGALLLLLAVVRMEPLREDNFDFGLLGPGWLAVALFVAIGLFQGMLLVAFAGRAAGGRRLFSPLPRAGRAATAGRVAAGVLVLVALPGAIAAVAEILSSA